MSNCVLLDRDGVINEDRTGSVLHRAEFRMLAGAGRAIAQINRKGYRVLVLTNQACVARGELSLEELQAIHALMKRLVRDAGGKINGIYVCPHADQEECTCRKPKPGLVWQAQSEFGFEPEQTWMVGDAQRDIEAAMRAGCRPALVRTGKGGSVIPGPGVTVFENLEQFARSLPEHQRPT